MKLVGAITIVRVMYFHGSDSISMEEVVVTFIEVNPPTFMQAIFTFMAHGSDFISQKNVGEALQAAQLPVVPPRTLRRFSEVSAAKELKFLGRTTVCTHIVYMPIYL